MGVARFAALLGAAAVFVSACAEPPVKPIPDAIRASVTTFSADISGVKDSDTSTIAARGSDEGGRRGAAQGARATTRSGTLLGLLLAPVGAAVGGAKGAAEAQSETVVDEARANLRIAMQETDFAELLRSRLAASKAAGTIEIVDVTLGPSSAAGQSTDGRPVGHVIALEYRVGILHAQEVNPKISVLAVVKAQVQSPDRKTLLHKATWTYCGERDDFVRMGAAGAAALRAQIDTAATILAEAIPYDLYVSKQPRDVKLVCMDFSDLPSGRGRKAPSLS